ncbi:MAG: hypothetical protein ABSE89_11415 [Sedimentisphaerales bacterium]
MEQLTAAPVDIVLSDRILNFVCREIRVVCKLGSVLYKFYQSGSPPSERSPSGFHSFVRNRRKATNDRIKQHLLERLLAYIQILDRCYAEEGASPEDRYEDIKDGFNQLSTRADVARLTRHETLASPRPCYDSTQKDNVKCPTRQLLQVFFNNLGQRLAQEADTFCEDIERDLTFMAIALTRRLKCQLPKVTGNSYQRVALLAFFLANMFENYDTENETSLYLQALAAWSQDGWNMSRVRFLLERVQEELMSSPRRCFCRRISATQLALGTMHVWNERRCQFGAFEGADGFFSFDRWLSFCRFLKLSKKIQHMGVECRREDKYPWKDFMADIKIANQWQNIYVFEECMGGNGFSAKTDAGQFAAYDTHQIRWCKSSIPRQYFSLFSKPSQPSRFRYMFDVEPDPLQSLISRV